MMDVVGFFFYYSSLKMDKEEPVEPSGEKLTSEVEKEEEDGADDAEKNEPSKDNLRRVGMKRSFDVAFLTGSDATTTRTAVTTTTTGGNSAPEEVEEHKSAFSRYVKRFVGGCFFAQMSHRCRSHFHCFIL